MKIEKNLLDKITSSICWVLLIGTGLFLIVYWNQIPDQIPGHYNASGQIDRITDKGSLLFLYGITWLLYGMFLFIEKYPAMWNMGVKATKENRKQTYRIEKDMLSTLKCILVMIFSFLTFYSTTGNNLPILFLPISLGGCIGAIAISLLRKILIKNNKTEEKNQ